MESLRRFRLGQAAEFIPTGSAFGISRNSAVIGTWPVPSNSTHEASGAPVLGKEGRTRIRAANLVAKRHTIGYFSHMKIFSWSDEKNERLKRDRKVSFEAVLFHIERGDLLDIVTHPNQEKYGGQKMFVVNIENYVSVVPFVETEEEVFLITIIPSRKATSKYLREGS